ncbi:MAG: cyclic nucleotide-binding domain-containing protein [Desulfobacterales bacterium]|nr:cyclic nucleotide-binding domain-containing protein [Desulfobacterales bacterium]
MVSREDLKQIVILKYLDDQMLDKLMPLVNQMMYHQNDIIFKEGDMADYFFMLARGKVLLEKRLSEKVTVSVGAVKAGFSFGWSSMLDDGAYTSDAVCAETCAVYSVRREKMLTLMNADPSMGYIFTQRLLRIIKKRLDHRTEQFLRAIQNHPDIQSLF